MQQDVLVGATAAVVSAITYGSTYVPVRWFEAGDGKIFVASPSLKPEHREVLLVFQETSQLLFRQNDAIFCKLKRRTINGLKGQAAEKSVPCVLSIAVFSRNSVVFILFSGQVLVPGIAVPAP
ncbi:hypothetical protein ANCDUO_22846 [Ancylostoma duodenale]|uniref:Uncharacterized protein n=1 Tax=Ancylostoma duodenale TaxID=51022 RepID=A0A0C2BT71_9BILA|nr:hypothetical protein ANCDUO_22846 [Ancylostoma duodenale]